MSFNWGFFVFWVFLLSISLGFSVKIQEGNDSNIGYAQLLLVVNVETALEGIMTSSYNRILSKIPKKTLRVHVLKSARSSVKTSLGSGKYLVKEVGSCSLSYSSYWEVFVLA